MTKHALQKRLSGKLHTAVTNAAGEGGDAARKKWQGIMELKGKRGSQVNLHKKNFLYAWVSNPDWSDAYFSQTLSLEEVTTNKIKGTWITKGRLEQLIGEKEAKIALKENWWQVQQQDGTSKMMIYYTEEGDEHEKKKLLGKVIKGGSQLSIEDGKQMMIENVGQNWSQAMLGVSEAELQAPAPALGGMGVGMKPLEPCSAANVKKRPSAAKAEDPPPKILKKPMSKAAQQAEEEQKKKQNEEVNLQSVIC